MWTESARRANVAGIVYLRFRRVTSSLSVSTHQVIEIRGVRVFLLRWDILMMLRCVEKLPKSSPDVSEPLRIRVIEEENAGDVRTRAVRQNRTTIGICIPTISLHSGSVLSL